MTDTVSKNDIDDVLSSIRRLVSAHPSSSDRFVLKEEFQVPGTGVEGHFVLTEEHRVPESASSVDDDAESDDRISNPDQDAPETASASMPPRRVLRLLPDAGDVANIVDEHTTDSDPDWNSAALFFSSRTTEEKVKNKEPEDQVDSAPTAVHADNPPIDFQSRRVLEQTIADLEQAVGSQADEWEPDGTNSEQEVPDRILHISSPKDQIAEHDATLDSREGEALTEDIVAEDEEPLHEDEDPADFGLIDENTLHELVTEIVRQELQGALGERITRNVRKLVRREIQLALTAKKLD